MAAPKVTTGSAATKTIKVFFILILSLNPDLIYSKDSFYYFNCLKINFLLNLILKYRFFTFVKRDYFF